MRSGNSEPANSVLVSACLLGEKCRYNGKGYTLPDLVEGLSGYSVVPACPELLGGLPVPRPPCELRGGDGELVWQEQAGVFTEDGRDLTIAFREGACKTLELARKNGVKMAVLKDHSPSCGCNKIYDGSFCRRLVTGVGVTAALLKKHGIKVIAETDWSMQRRSNDV
ncbi:MAG: DUF523 domain-containing protein [Firmicutes bacterium]|nr:DUF523 domain-containing protein [Bacillota bacterium]